MLTRDAGIGCFHKQARCSHSRHVNTVACEVIHFQEGSITAELLRLNLNHCVQSIQIWFVPTERPQITVNMLHRRWQAHESVEKDSKNNYVGGASSVSLQCIQTGGQLSG